MTSPFRLEPLAEHVRGGFLCGEEVLDRYFQTQVTQDIRRHLANCFVAVEAATGNTAGFYTIAAAGILARDLPPEVTKRLPRYPTLPAVRIGRLAVDERFHRRHLGAALLGDAAERALSMSAASFTVLVDAKSDKAIAFYEHHGFLRLPSNPRTLFLPLATVEKARKLPR